MSDFTNAAKKMVSIVKDTKTKGPKPYDAKAEVKRVDLEERKAFVSFGNGIDETPVDLTCECSPGDIVPVRIANGRAWIYGNQTDPPASGRRVTNLTNYVNKTVGEAVNNIGLQIADINDDINELQGKIIEKIVIEYCLATARSLQEGQTFDDIKATGYDWSEEIPDIPEGQTLYYWRRFVIYCVDGTVIYTEPEFANDLQVSVEAAAVAEAAQEAAEDAQEAAEAAASEAQDAKDAAETAQGAAETARDEAVAEAGEAKGIAEQAAADASAASTAVTNQQKYFFHNNTGAHVSETENSTATGAAANIGSNVVTLTKDNKLTASFGQNALNFYDGRGSSTAANDLLASYNRAGITFYTQNADSNPGNVNVRAMSLAPGSLSFWDSTDTGSSQKLLSQFTKTSSNFYSGGNLAASFGADSVNFYSAESSNKTLAAYSKAGITFYEQGIRSTSLTNSSVTFWDSSDTSTSNQRMLALYSKLGANFYGYTTSGSTTTGGLVANLAKAALNFYDGRGSSTSTDDLLATYTRAGISLFTQSAASSPNTKNSRAMSLTPSGLTFWDPSDTTNNNTDNQRKEALFGSSGATFYKDGTDIASFGTTARIGASTSSRFVMDASKLEAFDSNNSKYFQVSASGIKFGSGLTNDVATQSSLTDEINARKAIYGTSSTGASTQTKVVSLTNFELYTGATITVGFTNANSNSAPKLNVNSTGAKDVKSYTGAALTSAEYSWAAGAVIDFVYDGTYWRMQDAGTLQAKADAASSASAASSSASDASASASAASGSASSASSSASSASSSASSASSSASTASSKATDASNSATAAANSATSASGSATNASNSATAASGSATNAANSATAAANSAATALDTVTVKDTRNDNQNPQWYITNYPKKRVQEFKTTTAIGLTGNTYTWLQTDVPWGDSSGGWPKQTAEVNGKQYWRQGASSSTWSDWVDAYGTAVNSAKTATDYFVDIGDSGIYISPKNQTPSSGSEGNSVKIDGDGMVIYKGGTAISSYGTSTRIGASNANNVFISTSGIKMYSSASSSYPIFQASYSTSNSATQRAYWNKTVSSSTTSASKTVYLKVNGSVSAVYVKCRTYGSSGNVLYEENLSLPGTTAHGSGTFGDVASLTYTSTSSYVTVTATHNSNKPDHSVEMLNIDIIYDVSANYPKVLCGYRPDTEGGVFGIGNGSDANVFDIDYEGNVMSQGIMDVTGIRVYGMPPLRVVQAKLDNKTIAKSDGETVTLSLTIPTGYTAIGIVGFNISNASSSGSGASNVYVRGAYLSGTTPTIKVENLSSTSSVKILISMNVLCTAMQ